MRKTLLSLAFLASAAPALAAPPPFSADAFRAHVAFLADDLLEGRDTGSRGHEIAASYIATQFAALGLKPGGDKGGWFQRIRFASIAQAAPGALTLNGPGGSRSFTDGDGLLIRRHPAHPNPDVSGDLVFAGFGVDDPKNGHDDYRGLDVRGKIVVLLRGFPKGTPSEAGAFYSLTARRTAARHGAKAVIFIETISGAKIRPWSSQLRNARFPTVVSIDPDGRPRDEYGLEVSAAADRPLAEAMFAGAPTSLAAVLKEAERTGGKPRGFALRTSARLVDHTVTTEISSPNVIGILPGNDPTLKAEYVVLSAHADHIGITPAKPDDKPGTDRINNGAMDNAAGIATLIEVARAATQDPDKPRRSLIFLACTAEEKGLLGADYYARNPTVPAKAIVGDVDLDMPVLTYPFTDVIAYGAEHSTIGAAVSTAARSMGLTLSPDPNPEQTIFVRSDHYRFVEQGVPAVFLVNGWAGAGKAAWATFEDEHYHQPSDDMNLPVDWKQGARFAEINYRVTRAIADADQRPLWNKGDFFGDRFGAPQSRATR